MSGPPAREEPEPAFLDAEWRSLAMLHWEVDPELVSPLVPAGTELDDHGGRHFLSLVGFMFLRPRVLGVPVPFHGVTYSA